MENVSAFGKRLRELREKANISQTELANELKVSRGAISFYENGERIPNIDFLQDVALLFDVSFDYLLGYQNCYHPTPVGSFSELSTEAAEKLMEYLDDSPEIINLIFNHSSFATVLFKIENICFLGRENLRARLSGEAKLSERDRFQNFYIDYEFASFEITKMFMEIVQDIIRTEVYGNLTTEETKKINELHEATMRKYEAMKSEGRLISEGLLESSKREYQDSLRFAIRHKTAKKEGEPNGNNSKP